MTKTLTIVIPAYNEDEILPVFLRQLLDVTGNVSRCEVSVLVVNDGSSDKTAEKVKVVAQSDQRIRLLSFARNLGHQRALIAGLEHARGDAVLMMDADGQHPPEKAREMIELWLTNPSRHVIQAVRRGRQDGNAKNGFSALFYWVVRRLCPEFSIMAGMSDFRLMDREALTLVGRYPDRHRNLRLLVASLPMPIHFVEYDVLRRLGGQSKYSLSKMIHLAADGIFAYSNMPLRLSLYLCGITAAASMVFFAYSLVMHWRGATVWGWASLVCLITGLFSCMFATLAIISEYVARIYEDVRARPMYWIDPSNSVGLEQTVDDRGGESCLG